MEDINVFTYSKLKLMNEKPSKIFSWIFILSITLIIFIILSIFFKYHLYSSHIGYVEINNNYNLKIIIDDKIFPIKKDYILYINNKKYKYKIINIEKKQGYYELLINCNLDKKLLINNNIVTVKFQKEKTTLIKEILKKLKKGMV